MARFVARVFRENVVSSYVLRYNSLMRSSFKARFVDGEMFILRAKGFFFVFGEFNILLPKFWFIFLFLSVGFFLLWGFGPLLLLLLLFSSSAYFWSSWFARWLFKRGLRRAGYSGEVLFYG